jgi:hypothetical protein
MDRAHLRIDVPCTSRTRISTVHVLYCVAGQTILSDGLYVNEPTQKRRGPAVAARVCGCDGQMGGVTCPRTPARRSDRRRA